MDMQRCAHNRQKMYCEQLTENCSTVYDFFAQFRSSRVRFHSSLGNKVISITFSRDWREFFCYISYGFQDTLFQARKTEILEVRQRRFSNFFDNQNDYSKKLSSVSRQYLCVEYTRKTGLTDAHNFKKLAAKIWTVYLLHLCARVWYDCTNSCSADLLHRLLKDTALLVVATPA